MQTKIFRILFSLVVIFLFIANTTSAQKYLPFPDSNAVWILEQDDGFGGSTFFGHSCDGDTMINTMMYTKIYSYYYHGAYRNDTNGIMYYLSKDSTNEYVIRDFSKEKGDTLRDIYFFHRLGSPKTEELLVDFIVDSINYIKMESYQLKRMYLSSNALDTMYDGFYWGEQIVWIERVGCTIGGFFNNMRGGFDFNWLYCMSSNDTIYYESSCGPYSGEVVYEYGKCAIVGISENSQTNNEIEITPNPFDNQITINNIGDNKSCEYQIYNSTGSLIKQGLLETKKQNTLHLQGLNPGIYFIIIRNGDKVLKSEKLIRI